MEVAGVSSSCTAVGAGPAPAATAARAGYCALPPPLQYFEAGGSTDEPAPGVRGGDRESRNRAEKQRRNTLNAYIKELALLLPAVASSTRKVDKTGTLRLAANDLRQEHVWGGSVKRCHMELRPSRALELLELLGGFMLTVTCRGVVAVVSPNVQRHLGHCPLDLLGRNLYSLVHPEDSRALERHLYPPELHAAHAEHAEHADPDAEPASGVYGERREFCVRLLRACPRSEPPQYETCRIEGALRRADKAPPRGLRDEQIIRRQRVRRDRTISSSGNDVVFNGMVRVLPRATPTLRTLPAGAHTEYWTRHLIDGRIVQCDQRVSLVAGYMTEEVTGVSGFTFMHKDDVRWVVFLLRQMYDQSKECGESCYRLMSATGQFIYLKTRGFLEIDKRTKAVQSFVCVNSIVSDEEGRRTIEEMKRKYSVIVNLEHREDENAGVSDRRAIEDPLQLEQVIMHLVTNLPSPGGAALSEDEGPGSATPPPPPAPSAAEPLTIIPPEPATIGIAIRKSVSVICQAGIKFDTEPEELGRCASKRTISKLGCDSDSDVVKRRNSEHC